MNSVLSMFECRENLNSSGVAPLAGTHLPEKQVAWGSSHCWSGLKMCGLDVLTGPYSGIVI